jgi:hypothetical protein
MPRTHQCIVRTDRADTGSRPSISPETSTHPASNASPASVSAALPSATSAAAKRCSLKSGYAQAAAASPSSRMRLMCAKKFQLAWAVGAARCRSAEAAQPRVCDAVETCVP